MYYFTAQQIALSKTIEHEPFEDLFNGEKSLFKALCNSSSTFRELSDLEQLKEAAFVGVLLRLRSRNVSVNCKLKHNQRPPRQIAHNYLVHVFKHHNKAIITDALGCEVDIVEIGQFLQCYRGRKLLSAINVYLVEAGIIKEIDTLRMVVKSNRVFPKKRK